MSELSLKHSCTILWAQRNATLFLTAEIEDFKTDEITCNGNHLVIKGSNKTARYEIELDLYGDLKWDEHKKIESSRHIELSVPKEKEDWWPRLLKDSKKVQWIKVDFGKWVDEDEEQEQEDAAMQSMFANMGGNMSGFQFPGGGGAMDNIGTFGDDDFGASGIGDDGADDESDEAEGHDEKPGTSSSV